METVEMFGKQVAAGDADQLLTDISAYGCGFVDEEGRRVDPAVRETYEENGRVVHSVRLRS